jgi:hypothetical protein
MFGCMFEIAEITVEVVVAEEAWFAVIAALDDMLGNTRQTEAGFASDWPILPVKDRTLTIVSTYSLWY